MRIASLFAFLGVLAITPAAFADSLGRGCGPYDDNPIKPPDFTVPRDMSVTQPHDMRPPTDARRETHRRHKQAGALGMGLMAAASLAGVVVARRRKERA